MIAEVFGPEGILERESPGYEPRPGQVRMAEAVERAIAEKRSLAVEAPCGIGKTYAYLVPAIAAAIASETRVIVCTANIALQEQIFAKDLPALARILPKRFTYALIKGINNYLCEDRFLGGATLLPGFRFSKAQFAQWKAIETWKEKTRTGDVSDLDFVPDDSVWNEVNGVSELCNARQCLFYERCFAMDARRRLRGAQVIVTNYHLFCAHLALRASGAGDVLFPHASVVVCDEAHDLADIAREFFGLRLSPYSTRMLVRGAHHFGEGGLALDLRSASDEFFERIRRHPEHRLRAPRWISTDRLLQVLDRFRSMLRERRDSMEDAGVLDKAAKFANAADRYQATLRSFVELDDPNMVHWIERDGSSACLQSRVIDVSGILRRTLFEETGTVILTSSTLTAAGDFEFLKRETGSQEAQELRVESPFNYWERSALVIPRMKSAPNDDDFATEMAEHINRIVRFMGGRTMCLFTSYRNLEICAEAARETGVTILRQGEGPRSKLLESFRRDEGTALFATASFWQGVDVPGEALSVLTIDKIPFQNPGDPLLEAIQEKDPNSFSQYSLPKAILALRQGFGRLIRRRSDRGVVVIFDNRLFTKPYGSDVLSSLPACPIYRDLARLQKFFPRASSPVE